METYFSLSVNSKHRALFESELRLRDIFFKRVEEESSKYITTYVFMDKDYTKVHTAILSFKLEDTTWKIRWLSIWYVIKDVMKYWAIAILVLLLAGLGWKAIKTISVYFNL